MMIFFSNGATIVKRGEKNQFHTGIAEMSHHLDDQASAAKMVAAMLTQHGQMLEAMEQQAQALEDTGHDVPQTFLDLIAQARETTK